MPDAELALGLVGCGRLAEVGYLAAMRAAEGVRLAGVADPDPVRRESLAGRARRDGNATTAASDAAELLAATALDGIVLATPAPTHVDDARRAAAVGVPALVEKPPAPDGTAARELARLDPAPRVGFNRRFEDGTAELREAAGGPCELRLQLAYRRSGWGAHTVADDALLDLGPHLIDLARWLTGGEVTAARARILSRRRAVFELGLTGARASLRCATDRPHRELVEVVSPDGGVLAARRRGGLVENLRNRLIPGGEHPLVACLTRQLESFAAVISGGADQTLGTAADGAAVMATVDALRASADDAGRQVAVAPPRAHPRVD